MNPFFDKVEKTRTCWNWKGSLTHNGYGQFSFNNWTYRAHRFMFSMTYGEIPDGVMVLHSCDNRKCVNPEHLRLGTAKENAKDRRLRKRTAVGEFNGASRLSEQDVREIRKLYKDGYSQPKLAEKFKLSAGHIGRIVRREVWKQVK